MDWFKQTNSFKWIKLIPNLDLKQYKTTGIFQNKFWLGSDNFFQPNSLVLIRWFHSLSTPVTITISASLWTTVSSSISTLTPCTSLLLMFLTSWPSTPCPVSRADSWKQISQPGLRWCNYCRKWQTPAKSKVDLSPSFSHLCHFSFFPVMIYWHQVAKQYN